MPMARRFAVILATTFLANLSFRMSTAVFSNFAAQELGIGPGDYGLLEGIREVPGLLTVFLAAVTAALAEERLYTACIALLGTGIGLYAFTANWAGLVATTLIQSVGFHLWYVAQESMVLKDAGPQRALRLGQLNSAAAAATLAGSAAVWLLSRRLSLRQLFLVAGAAGLAGAALALSLPRDRSAPRRERFVFRRAYRSYYILTLLNGARRHMVLTFAAFALVKLYGTPVGTMAVLMAAANLLSVWARPWIGRVIDRVGDLRAITYSYGALALVFVGYALIRRPWVAYALYITDQVLVGFDVAISAYAARLVPREELAPTLATGTTINHIFGVAVPVLGGTLWALFGPVVPFLFGTAVALAAAGYAAALAARPPAPAPTPPPALRPGRAAAPESPP